MGFTPGILRSIEELGFTTPMPVQEKVIPLMLGNDTDIIALAQTGTGKTAAFGLPLVQATDTETFISLALVFSVIAIASAPSANTTMNRPVVGSGNRY